MEIVPARSLAPPASLDEGLRRMWLHNRPANTATAYDRDACRFLAFVEKPLSAVTLSDLQAFADSLSADSPATRNRRLMAVKSLFSFAHELGVLPLNPAAALKVRKAEITTGDRVLSPVDMARMIAAETDPRRRALLRLLYVCGLRASEACDLRWRHLRGNDRKGGEASVIGKGGKMRLVAVPADLWRELASLNSASSPDTPVVAGRDGQALERKAIHRAVKRAARRAGISDAVSAHWLRHSHATHAMANGCKIDVLQRALGHASLATTTRYLHRTDGEGSANFIKS